MPVVATAGSNEYGQLGRLGDTSIFKVVDIQDDIVQICCGGDFTLALTSSGVVYGWGRNNSGQLALPPPIVDRPTRVTDYATNGFRVVKVGCGKSHSLFLTSSGKIYSSGEGSCGQRGDGTYHGPCFELKQVLLEQNAKDVFCGARTSYAITADGELYGWGETTSGMLGISSLPTPALSRPTRIFVGPPRIRIARIVASRNFAILVTTTGEILGAGNNSSGQLGISDHSTCSWRPIRDVGRVSQVACGYRLTVCYQEEKNRCVVLSNQLRSFPLSDVAGLASGSSEENILVWTTSGDLLVYGHNRDGKLGMGALPFIERFTCAPLPLKANVVSVSCGHGHTCLLLAGGVVRDMDYVISMEDSLSECNHNTALRGMYRLYPSFKWICFGTSITALVCGLLLAKQRCACR